MPFDLDFLARYVLALIAFLAAFGSALWLSLIFWTYRDMRARTHDIFLALLAALLVALLNLPGVVIYLILRPPLTLTERYTQSLEEEALLQGIEEKRVCPGCNRNTAEDWLVCPNCHTRLKKACLHCGRLLDLPWNMCPYCATPVENLALPDEDQPEPERSPQGTATA